MLLGVGAWNQLPRDPLGVALFQDSLQSLVAAGCQNVFVYLFSFFSLSSCTFAIYLHLSVQLSFDLHNETSVHKGNSVPVHRCGALQLHERVVAVVIGVASPLGLTPPPPPPVGGVIDIVSGTVASCFPAASCHSRPMWWWDGLTPTLFCFSPSKHTRWKTVKAAAGAAKSQWTYTVSSFYSDLKKKCYWEIEVEIYDTSKSVQICTDAEVHLLTQLI